MANDVFSIKNDIFIEFYTPTAGNWVWGVSTWDGGDVWGGSSSSIAWRDLKCESVQVQTSQGFDIDNGIFLNPAQKRATITMQSPEYDPFAHGTIHAGTPVRVRARLHPDSDPTAREILYVGTVESFASTYDHYGNNIATFTCVDPMQAWLNTRVASYTITASTSYPLDVISDMAAYGTWAYITSGGTGDIAYLDAKTYTDVTVGDIIKDALKAGLGALATTTDTTALIYYSESDMTAILNQSPIRSFSSDHSTSTDHICFSDVQFAADARELPNEIIATAVGGTTYTLRNQDSYDLYGAISLQVDLQFSSSTSVNAWLDRLNLTNQLRRVQTLTFPSIKREGQVATYWGAAGLFSYVNVTYALGSININQDYFITKESQLITPDEWTTTLELWRGI